MIIITSPEQFTAATKRAKELKPRVWAGSTFGTYFVEGQSQDYRVEFGKVNGQFAGECNCEAGHRNKICYHLLVSLLLHRIQVGIRRQVKASQLPSVANWVVNELEAA
jgi:hypothetical protein